MAALNDAFRFLLELGGLAALGVWGFRTGDTALARWLLGLGAPLALATYWSVLLAPRSSHRLEDPLRLLAEAVAFGAATWALVAIGEGRWALIFGTSVLLHTAARLLIARG